MRVALATWLLEFRFIFESVSSDEPSALVQVQSLSTADPLTKQICKEDTRNKKLLVTSASLLVTRSY